MPPVPKPFTERVHIDHTSLLHCREVNGVVREVTRRVRVTGFGAGTDYNRLNDALIALGIPKVPTDLAGAGFEMLKLADRTVSIVEDDPGTFDVDLHYVHILDGSQEMEANTIIFGRIHASLGQVPTNFYFDYDADGFPVAIHQITVAHTFPAVGDSVTILGQVITFPGDPDYPGQTLVQGGEIQVTKIQKNFVVEFFWTLGLPDKPTDLENNILRTVNSVVWMGGAPRTWLCTDVQYECLDFGTKRYKYKVEWQFDEDTWDQGVVFEDKRTGQPPAKMVAGLGFWSVPWYFGLDFMDSFPPGVTFAEDPGP